MKKDFVLKEFYVETFQKLTGTNKVEAVNVEKFFYFLFTIFILYLRESELYRYIFGRYVRTLLGVGISEVSGPPVFLITVGHPVECLAQRHNKRTCRLILHNLPMNEQKSDRIFCIPHFVTKQAKKRLVYDGCAQFQNVSLNSVLYKGCDNLQRLCDVILRFRRFKIAFSCDIKDMFMQCEIVEQDRDLLRVLWFKDNDIANGIVEYRFKRLPFGLNYSMSMADCCLKKTADDNVVVILAEAIEAVKSSFYVDDGLISCKDAAKGRKCVNMIITLLQ